MIRRSVAAGSIAALAVAAAAFAAAAEASPAMALSMLAAALAYGSASPLVAARRLYFLSGAAAHAALLAAAVAIIASSRYGIDPWPPTLLLGLALVYTVGYSIHRGVDPDAATAVFVAATSSLTSIALLAVAGVGDPHEAARVVAGEPARASWEDAAWAWAAAAVIAGLSQLTYRVQVYIGVDRDDARLAGLRVDVYDAALYTAIGLAAVGLVRVTGFIVEHVLFLIPAAAAATLAASSAEARLVSLTLSLAAASLGSLTASATSTSPAGLTGLFLLLLYLAGLLYARRAR